MSDYDDFAEIVKMWPNTTANGRAFAVCLWLRYVTGIELCDMRPDDIDRMPPNRFVREFLRTKFDQMSKWKNPRRFAGYSTVWDAALAMWKKKLPRTTWAAFSAWPPRRPVGPPVVDPHADDATTRARNRVVRKATSAAERELRSRIAAGELPASMLATRMQPAKRPKTAPARPDGTAA